MNIDGTWVIFAATEILPIDSPPDQMCEIKFRTFRARSGRLALIQIN
jgi:hypothetical protein